MPGCLLRSAGEQPDALSAYGYSPDLVRIIAVTVGGMLAGIGGAQLSTAYANAWFENMTQGRGFIAVALVIFAAWDPIKAVFGAYLFGAALALAPALQARGYSLNQFALDVLPYVMTLIALVSVRPQARRARARRTQGRVRARSVQLTRTEPDRLPATNNSGENHDATNQSAHSHRRAGVDRRGMR